MSRMSLLKKWIFWGVNLVLTVCVIVFAILGRQTRHTLTTLNAADTWAGESGMPFAQLACYVPNEELLAEDSVFQLRSQLEKKLRDASLDAPENGSLFTDAYSGKLQLSVEGERGTAPATAIGVGGDFFRFHPLQLRSGSYLAETDLMQDRVLLDEELAWRLFGGVDLTGMSIRIGRDSYYIAGVVAREKDPCSTLANTAEMSLYMSYSAMQKLQEQPLISCYEIVLPNMITSFGKNMLTEVFPVSSAVIVENSSRYSVGNLLQVIGDFGKRSMGVNGIIYPYWENAVRLTEDYAALFLVLTVLFAIMPVVSVLTVLIRLIRKSASGASKGIRNGISDKIEQHKMKKWQKTAGKKEE